MPGPRRQTTNRSAIGLAILAGVAAVALARAPRALLPSRPCAALAEVTTFWLSRLLPDLPVSAWLSWMNAALLFVGVFGITRLAQRLSGRIVAGAAIGGAIAAWAATPPVFLAFAGAGPLVAAAAAGLSVAPAQRRSPLAAWAVLAFAVALWPSSLLACVVVFAWAQRTAPARQGSTLVAAAALALVGILIPFAAGSAPSLASAATCMAPSLSGAFLSQPAAVFVRVGPYVIALAALGMFSRRREIRVWPWLAMAIALVMAPEAAGAVAPVIVGLAAACGLSEVMRACRPSAGGRLAAVLLVALVPVLAWQSALSAGAPLVSSRTLGHDGLSLRSMRHLVAALPANARLLPEDVTTDALVGAAAQSPLTVAPPPDMNRVAAALSNGDRLFALPLAQRELAQLGFQLTDLLPGLAEVRPGAPCRLATAEWRSSGDLDATALTIAARAPAEAGPVVVYAGFDERPVLTPIEWPSLALRGFYTTIYDLNSPGEMAQLARDVSDDGAPAARVSRTRAFVARLELWRTPTAPLRLTVGLGARPHDLLTKVIARSEPRRLWVCPSYPHAVQPFAR